MQPHSKSHSNLAVRQADENGRRYRERVRREIEAPMEAIRRELGRAAGLRVSLRRRQRRRAAELRSRGIEMGVTVTPGGNAFYAPPLMLRRTMIFGGDELDAFRGQAGLPPSRREAVTMPRVRMRRRAPCSAACAPVRRAPAPDAAPGAGARRVVREHAPARRRRDRTAGGAREGGERGRRSRAGAGASRVLALLDPATRSIAAR